LIRLNAAGRPAAPNPSSHQKEVAMLKKLSVRQARRIAELATAARAARDSLIHGAEDELVEEPHPVRGASDRAGASGFEIMPPSDRSLAALRSAIAGLRPDARSELFALMRIGQGELAPGDWPRGLSEATTLGAENVGGVLADDVDLPSHLSKGLYQLGLS